MLHYVRVTHVWLIKLRQGHVTRVCIDNSSEPICLREKYPYRGITPHKKYIFLTMYKRGFTPEHPPHLCCIPASSEPHPSFLTVRQSRRGRLGIPTLLRTLDLLQKHLKVSCHVETIPVTCRHFRWRECGRTCGDPAETSLADVSAPLYLV